jgi:hypothetical protein
MSKPFGLVLALALAGCATTSPLQLTSQPQPADPPARTVALGEASTPPDSGIPDSLPFASLYADEPGTGRLLEAGADERVVLRSAADLEAFLARHPRTFPGKGQPAPAPNSSPTPPGGPAWAPIVNGTPIPLPAALTGLDWAKYEAIALCDGHVQYAATSRITAVVQGPDGLAVHSMRWEPPQNPGSGADANSRVHVIAIPRSEQPVAFEPLKITNVVAKPDTGAIVIGNNPPINPQWKAVQNPVVTREAVDALFRGKLKDAKLTSYELELRSVAWIQAHGDAYVDRQHYTPDSMLWFGHATGEFVVDDFPFLHLGPRVGGSDETHGISAKILVSPESLEPLTWGFEPAPTDPGFGFHLQVPDQLVQGDALTFQVSGNPVPGSVQLTVAPANGKATDMQIALKDLGTFSLPVDRAHVPGLSPLDYQELTITLRYPPRKYDNGVQTVRVQLRRDRGLAP